MMAIPHSRFAARGQSAWGAADSGADPLREAELVAIVDALRDPQSRQYGLPRAELRHRLGADTWEPGRYGAALHHAVVTGLVLELAPGRYALADPHP